MCIRCRERAAGDVQLAMCPACELVTRLEVATGIRRFADYLAAWDDFTAWQRDRPAESG